MQPSPRVRPALETLCRRIVPAAWDHDPPVDIVAHVERRIAALEPPLRRDIIGALHFFDHPITGMLLSGRPRRFSTLAPFEQDALLREWERSPLGLRRTVYQALRRLILATYYTLPESRDGLGLAPPLHVREPLVDWEGPDAAAPEDGPVARTAAETARPVDWPPGIRDAAELPDGARLTADVCVIGSGAGGSVVAARLAAEGHRVIVLEEGPFLAGTDLDGDEARLTPALYADGGARATDDLSFILLQGRCVGGGTTVNWMMTLRPMPWVMHEWEREHGIELLSEAMLAPAMCGIESAIHARPVPDSAHNPPNRIIVDGARQLGWRLLDAKINARGCIRAGTCGLGCRWGAKRSACDVFLPAALRDGATVFAGLRADRIERIERGALQDSRGTPPLKRIHATSLDPVARTPRARVVIDAPIVVLAAGGIGSPALLERSGLGGGAVGRWLRLHPTTAVFGVYDRLMYGAAGIPQSAACGEFLQGDDGHGFWIECPPLPTGLAAAALQGFGDEHRRHMLGFARFGPLIVLVRDGADRARSSGDVRVDRRGRVRIRYRLGRADRRGLVRGVQAAARLHFATGAGRALTLHVGAEPLRDPRDIDRIADASFEPNRVSLFSAHVNGTCRMGVDPRDSACDPEGRRHGVPGLYVADGSLFPTAPGVNPQLAIMALAALVADRIAERHRA